MAKRVSIDSWKLIEAAEDFAKHKGGKGGPRPVWLRRAVSTAYYALYHCMARAVAEHVLPNGGGEDQLRLTRLFRHNGFKGTCAQIAGRKGGKSNEHLDPLSAQLRASPLLHVASVFYDLQEARHKADYDHLESFSKQQTMALIGDARTALETLESAMPSEREAFLALLAMSVRG